MSAERWFEPTDGLAFVLRLLNSRDELEPEPELLRDPEVVARFLRRHGFDDAAALADDHELQALRDLRGRVRPAWDAERVEDAVGLLNALRLEQPWQPRLERAGGGWAYRWDAPGVRASAFAPALCAATVLEEIRAGRWERLGTCAAGPCRCVFADASRNRSRRFCSEQCADRAHQAAHRGRRRRG